jgi:hypothetical protein
VRIVTDFDRTLTRMTVPGKGPSRTSHQIIETARQMPADFRRQTTALFTEYYPKEISTTLTLVDKERAMVEWWTRCHDLQQRYGLKKSMLKDAGTPADVYACAACLRCMRGTPSTAPLVSSVLFIAHSPFACARSG